MNFSLTVLSQELSRLMTVAGLPAVANWRVGFSGGVDSLVLLHALDELSQQGLLPGKLAAIHVNHGIHPRATDWQNFCSDWCAARHIPLTVCKLQLTSTEKPGLEERAREQRYAQFSQQLAGNDVLLLAHQLDDQMETLFLRVLRGAGPAGLAGIPSFRTLGPGNLLRPLLNVSRQSLEVYAREAQLAWLEDDSNQDTDFDRNFCRHKLLPLIEERWPDYRERCSKTRELWDESAELLETLAAQDLIDIATDQDTVIDLDRLTAWSAPRQRNLLRYWLQQIGFPLVNWNLLQRLTTEIITARPDAPAWIHWQGARLQRFAGRLYALQELPPLQTQGLHWAWQQQAQILLPDNGALQANGNSAAARQLSADLSVRYRQGGEDCRLPGRPRKSVKQLLQEAGIAPWLRERMPLLFVDDSLAAVPGLGINVDGPLAQLDPGISFAWHTPDFHYRRLPPGP